MKITSYYRGSSDKVTGVTFDTDTKTFRQWVLEQIDWCYYHHDNSRIIVKPRDDFELPGDINYYHKYKREVTEKVDELIKLGFKEDNSMVLSFTKE